MGCGRVGSALAVRLEAEGHDVSIIDQEERAFRKLPAGFRGQTVLGVGFDRDVLNEAGIERAEAFAAVSSGDNSNILAARVARERFGIQNVVARIYDPKRAEIYQRLGIPTVASVTWQTTQMLRRLLPSGAQEEWRDATGSIVLAEIDFSPEWIGQLVVRLERQAGVRIALVTRYGDSLLPTAETVVQDGDLMHAVVPIADIERVAEVFARGPERN